MFRITLPQRWVLLIALALVSTIANAALVTSSNAFLGQLISPPAPNGNAYANHFENEGPGDLGYTTSPPYLGGTPTFHFTIETVGGGSGNNLYVIEPGGGTGRAMSTVAEGIDDTTDPGHPVQIGMRINFAGADLPSAVGANFFLTDVLGNRVGDPSTSDRFNITVFYSNSTDSDMAYHDRHSTDSGDLPFLGFTTDGTFFITSILFEPVDADGDQYATIDNLYVGQFNLAPVPEPAQAGLIAAFFLVACSVTHLWRRRAFSKVCAIAA